MNETELRDYMAARPASPNAENMDLSALTCYGCAHASAIDPPPGKPSGERPCCACIRNPERVRWAYENLRGETPEDDLPIVIDNRGHARSFEPYQGTQYNGVPMVYHPMDRYVTLDQGAQEDWLDDHPEYKGAITFKGDQPVVVDE